MRGRAIRRHHDERVKMRARWLLRRWQYGADPFAPPEPSARQIGRMTSAGMSPCSCAMCGNPRRHFGEPTLQELRHGRDDR